MRGWRAYDADFSEYPSVEVTWRELPARGLVGVVVYLSHPYRRIIDGHDWMWMEDGEIRVVDSDSEWGQWADPPDGVPAAMLKRGEGMDDDAWEDMRARMMGARSWP